MPPWRRVRLLDDGQAAPSLSPFFLRLSRVASSVTPRPGVSSRSTMTYIRSPRAIRRPRRRRTSGKRWSGWLITASSPAFPSRKLSRSIAKSRSPRPRPTPRSPRCDWTIRSLTTSCGRPASSRRSCSSRVRLPGSGRASGREFRRGSAVWRHDRQPGDSWSWHGLVRMLHVP